MSTATYTASQVGTYTEARANYIMNKVYEDLLGLVLRGVITKTRADSIRADVLYLLNKKCLSYFQLQFKKSDGSAIGGLHYELRADGNIHLDEGSGGINFWGLSNETIVKLLVQLDRNSPNIDVVDEQLEKWGWGSGSALNGTPEHLKDYSKEGYGFKQSRIGQW